MKFWVFLLFGLLTTQGISQAQSIYNGKSCFAFPGDQLLVVGETRLVSELYGYNQEPEVLRVLQPGEWILIKQLKIQSGIQLWIKVLTQADEEGWIFQGYWSAVDQGYASVCYP